MKEQKLYGVSSKLRSMKNKKNENLLFINLSIIGCFSMKRMNPIYAELIKTLNELKII